MQKITILSVGKIKEKYFQEACQEYLKRISPYVRVEMEEVGAESFFGEGDKEKAKEKEGERILKFLDRNDDCQIFLLEENGKEMDSVVFSQKLEKIQQSIIFVIAGALGFSDAVKKRGFEKLSLSQMTFPHELARLVLLEQVYRAATICNGKKYHY
ncbi:MAG: 23S rRNA (pseudouridine(1915)-N(3))-methyltransferase RlmH [Candidatus Moranbacteria bacterium]|jgi:23S rRNA (pseudouridine1915-N3)-methyltransferase|nr:23S rRNA (pseudouridine(1915)-N(3))-methyltransferase RlmH [Candidatus Moranbacteria bacterium]